MFITVFTTALHLFKSWDHALPFYLFKIHFNIILTSTNRFSKWFILSFPTAQYFSLPPCMLRSRPSLPPSQTVRRPLRWTSQTTATSHDITAVWQYRAPAKGCIRPSDRLHRSWNQPLARAVCCNHTVRTVTTKRNITVRECLLPICRPVRNACPPLC